MSEDAHNLCDVCGIGFRLPSGRCDHCNAVCVPGDGRNEIPALQAIADWASKPPAPQPLPAGPWKAYAVAEGDSQKEIEDLVDMMIVDGWQPIVSAVCDANGIVYCQAVVHTDPELNEYTRTKRNKGGK